MMGLCRLQLSPWKVYFLKATALVDCIVDPHEQAHTTEGDVVTAGPLMEPYRCHEVARAVGQVLDLPVQDGWYGSVDHSWLWLHADGDPYAFGGGILDVYAVGRLPVVQLLERDRRAGHYSAGGLSPSLFREGPLRNDIRQADIDAMVRDMNKLLGGA